MAYSPAKHLARRLAAIQAGVAPVPVADGAVTNAKLAAAIVQSVKANATDGLVSPADLAIGTNSLVGRGTANLRSLALGTNLSITDGTLNATGGGGGVTDGDKGDITVSGVGTVWTIDAGAVTLAKQADMATGSLVYRKTAAAGIPEVQTLATLKTDLLLTGTNSGDQATIVGITGTKAQFNTAATDGDFLFVGDAPTAHTHLLAAGATDVTITAANLNALDDGLNTALHFHDADRARANHTGTQAVTTLTGVLGAANGGTSQASLPLSLGALFGYTETATAAGTTTLTNASTYYQTFTGTLTQTVVFPVASVVVPGFSWLINNKSTGALTVNANAGGNICTIASTEVWLLTCNALTGGGSAAWNAVQLYTPTSGSGPTTAVAIVDFGAFPGASDASVAITGLASIVAGSRVSATIIATASVDHSADEHWVETIDVIAGNIVAATGFTIYAKNTGFGATRLYGKWNVAYSWAA